MVVTRMVVAWAALLISITTSAWPCVTALHIQSPTQRTSDQEALDTHWFVVASWATEQVQQLAFTSYCAVTVTYAATAPEVGVLATIRVRGHSPSTNAPPPVSSSRWNALQINANGGCGRGVELILHGQPQLRDLQLSGSGSVVVHDDALLVDNANTDLTINVMGSGGLTITPSPSTAVTARWLRVRGITITSRGSGDITITTGRVAAQSLDVQLSGAGDLVFRSQQLTVPAEGCVMAAAAGAGSICVEASDFTTGVLRVSVVSNGDITFAGHGSCGTGIFFVDGSGDLNAAGIGCVDLQVEVMNSGDVIAQASHSFVSHVLGSGGVFYTGPRPSNMQGSSAHDWLYAPPRPAQTNATKTCGLARTHIDTLASGQGNHITTTKGEGTGTTNTTASSSAVEKQGIITEPAGQLPPFLQADLVTMVGIGAGIVLLGVTVRNHRRRLRHGRAPLLGQDVPVYV